jgi:mannitol/fructose-specific phosphotransferase system IIA component (Ntr-type)
LLADNAIEKRYTDAMIRVVKEFGPYIVVTPGIAFPHAFPNDGVIKPSIALVKLRTPVNFGNKDNDPVWLLVALAAVDSSQYLEGLADVANVLWDEANVEELKNCHTPETLSAVFTRPRRVATV